MPLRCALGETATSTAPSAAGSTSAASSHDGSPPSEPDGASSSAAGAEGREGDAVDERDGGDEDGDGDGEDDAGFITAAELRKEAGRKQIAALLLSKGAKRTWRRTPTTTSTATHKPTTGTATFSGFGATFETTGGSSAQLF